MAAGMLGKHGCTPGTQPTKVPNEECGLPGYTPEECFMTFCRFENHKHDYEHNAVFFLWTSSAYSFL